MTREDVRCDECEAPSACARRLEIGGNEGKAHRASSLGGVGGGCGVWEGV
jgi:hypothetical protein